MSIKYLIWLLLLASAFGQIENPVSANGLSGMNAAQPVVATSPTTGTSSALYLDCSQFSGATLDIQLNKCNAAAITANGGTMDARALGGAQTLASEVVVGEPRFEPSDLSAVTATSPGAGTYKLAYTLNCSACITNGSSGESEPSGEQSITITGTQGIQVNAPAYPGTAMSYNVYMTAAAGSSWTEKKCAAATSVPIANNVTISAACSGASIFTGASGQAVKMLPPATGVWTVTIANSGVGCGLKFVAQSAFLGMDAGEGRAFYLTSNSSTNAEALWCTDDNPKGGNSYYNIRGLSAHGTASDTLSAVAIARNAADTSVFDDLQVTCPETAATICLWAYGNAGGSGAGTRVSGNFEGSQNGRPLLVGRNGFVTDSWNFHDISAVHPGTAYPNVELSYSLRNIHFSGTLYLEGNSTTCIDGVWLATGSNLTGPIHFDDVASSVCSPQAGSYLFNDSSASHTIGSLRVDGIKNNNYTNIFNYGPDTTKDITGWSTSSSGPGFIFGANQPMFYLAPPRMPTLKSTTGTRYVCVDTSGNLVSSASACSGT